MTMKHKAFLELKDILEEKADLYNRLTFIDDDPISIPHLFSKKEDIEISGLLTAIISWGQRKTLIRNAREMMTRMDDAPHDFVLNHSETELQRFQHFVHRTFNGNDCQFFIRRLGEVYRKHNTLEQLFALKSGSLFDGIVHFRQVMFDAAVPQGTSKHLADPSAGSAAKRINMYLRWMVRNDARKIDFGIWKSISMANLMIPLDVHSGGVARKLGILQRKQDDWRAVEELTGFLRQLDAADPVRFDYALFGMGVNEKLSR
jgi:uncharacterized protein (TIGR02757 family)